MEDLRVSRADARRHRASAAEAAAPLGVVIVVVFIAMAAVLAWYLRPSADPAPEPPPVASPSPAPEVRTPDRTGPRFPLPPAMPERSTPEDLTPLPRLDDSDGYFGLELSGLFGTGIGELLVDEALVEKFVATIDNLPSPLVAERIRPVGPLSEPFMIDGQDGSGEYTMNPASFDRYDVLVTILARADRDAVADVYRRFYPLFQEAYVGLGYPDRYFNDRVVEVIDHLLETPDVEEPIRLVRPHVLYEYEDPDLEALSAGQKLLIRIGSEHRVHVLQFLEEIRERIATEGGATP